MGRNVRTYFRQFNAVAFILGSADKSYIDKKGHFKSNFHQINFNDIYHISKVLLGPTLQSLLVSFMFHSCNWFIVMFSIIVSFQSVFIVWLT